MAKYMTLISKNHPEIAVSCLGDETDYNNLVWDGTSITKATLDAEWLDFYKNLKIAEIDERTVELIGLGFTFDSKHFSLSENAQTNWIGMKTMELLLTWPIEITTSGDESYSLTLANLNSFSGTALGTKQAHLDSGRALKILALAATDEAGVDAVVDNR
jgi:hypothetical protein